jgi:2-isopropylmalate synthase
VSSPWSHPTGVPGASPDTSGARDPAEGWVYDWNSTEEGPGAVALSRVLIDDETLRDGLQNPSAKDPSPDEKLRFLHILARIGVHSVDIGLPASGESAAAAALLLAKEVARHRLPLVLNCAARTLVKDIQPVLEISQKAGIPIEVATFLGSSTIRQVAERWDLDFLLSRTIEAVGCVVSAGLPSMFVTEDTTRARPEVLEALYTAAVRAGAGRVCIADTTGFATPDGASRIVRFIGEVVRKAGGDRVRIDWHGHQDRGLGIASSLAAYRAGAERLHGSGLGLGERVGNTPLELLVVNLKLMGLWDRDVTPLRDYVEWVSENCGLEIPPNYPVFGRNAFRTGTGIHAAAIFKAIQRGEMDIAERVYSSVPASWFGMKQVVELGPMSGESNAAYWLWSHGEAVEEGLVQHLLRAAKASQRTLLDGEIRAEIEMYKKGKGE